MSKDPIGEQLGPSVSYSWCAVREHYGKKYSSRELLV